MNKRTSGLILAGILATGAAGAVVIIPASAATSTNPVASRLATFKTALSSLVSDGTLTQTQADRVASTLDSKLAKPPMGGPGGFGGPRGHGGPGGPGGIGREQTDQAVAKVLGLTVDKLHVALEGGKSLAQVAKDQKVSVDSLVKVMVTAEEGELATAVKAGNLTQVQADAMKSSLTQRVTDRVNDVRHHGGPDGGPPGAGMVPPAGSTPGGTSTDPGTSATPSAT